MFGWLWFYTLPASLAISTSMNNGDESPGGHDRAAVVLSVFAAFVATPFVGESSELLCSDVSQRPAGVAGGGLSRSPALIAGHVAIHCRHFTAGTFAWSWPLWGR